VKVRALVSSFLRVALCIAALSGGPHRFAAAPRASEPRLDLTPSEIEIYKAAQTLIDWSPSQIRHSAYLGKLHSIESQDQLPKVLERVGRTVTLMFQDFPRVACDEVISETRPGQSGVQFMGDYAGVPITADYTARHKLRYIIIPSPSGDVPGFEEYRTDLNGNPIDAMSLRGFLMTSSKYVSTYLYFSPAYQHDSRFRYFGTEKIRGRESHVVGFAQEPEKARRIDRFLAPDGTFDLLFQGLAWIDSETFQILQITTWLLAPRKDIGIGSHTSTVEFYPVQPSGSERVLWLPRDVTVVLDYRGTRVRNTHRYSNFKLFRVESTIKPGG